MLREWTVEAPTTRTLRSIYFDTPDQRLRTAGISLRVRSDGDKWVQTIKTDARVSNGVSHAGELEAALGAPEPDLKAVSDGSLRRKLTRLTTGPALEPIFETVIERTARQLHTDTADLELALDQGVVRAGGAEMALCEAELELKSGTAVGLLETASKLFGNEPVRLAQGNKADRGYDLAAGRCSKDAPRPLSAEDVELADGATCREALVEFVQSATRQIVVNCLVVLETDDPEGAHKLRIGLRRLRSALAAFRPLIDTPATRELNRHARDLARVVGDLRDADVLIVNIFGSVAGAMKGHGGLQPLKDALKAHRLQMRDAARVALRETHWPTLQLYLALWPHTIEEVDSLDQPVATFAHHALNNAWKKVAKRGQHVGELEDEERHKMRKALKQLRYSLEFFGSLYNPADVKPFVGQLKKLQDLIGYVNDVATAGQLERISEAHCRQSLACQRAAGYIIGWHAAEAAHCWTRAENSWNELEETRRFWRHGPTKRRRRCRRATS
jgi:inorganic triphosphatase YgiF